MPDYMGWNDALVDHFFRPEMADRPVYLYVTEELISDLRRGAGEGIEDFAAAVKAGPSWVTREGFCQRAVQALDGWRARGLARPPYLAYLALFVLAAGVEGDFAPHAYYPRLRRLIGEGDGSTLPSFDRMLELWDDLERWSVDDHAGELGLFKARFVGSWIHVGVPISQRILTEDERDGLRTIFWEAGLDPRSLPPDAEMARVLRTHGDGRLRSRTLELLANRQDSDLYKVLIETVAEELADWDGLVAEPSSPDAQETNCGAVRLGLAIEPVLQSVRLSARCSLPSDFPEGELTLTSPELAGPAVCDGYVPGWSTFLVDSATRRPIDAAALPIEEGCVFSTPSGDWKFRLPGRAVRIFVDGLIEGLPGLVELYHLPASGRFHLLASHSAWRRLEPVLIQDCTGFDEVKVTAGVPSGWRLAKVEGVLNFQRFRSAFPFLAVPDRARIRFHGGIRHSRGNTFFVFAPPEVAIDASQATETVVCNGAKLPKSRTTGRYVLDPATATDTRLSIQVLRSGEIDARGSLYLMSDCDWRVLSPVLEVDSWGTLVDPRSVGGFRVSGPHVAGVAESRGFTLWTTIQAELGSWVSRRPGLQVALIGRAPGLIADWGKEIPDGWAPVWAIPLVAHPRPIYCGNDIQFSEPLKVPFNDRGRVRRWKELLWYRRKRLRPPAHPVLAGLWERFREVAKDA